MTRIQHHSRLRTMTRVAALLAAATLTSNASAGDTYIPGVENVPKIVEMKKIGSKWEMRDVSNGKLIMQERNCVPQTQGFDAQVQRTVEIRPQPSGYDMVVTFTNPTSQPLPAGAMYSGMFTLGPAVTYMDFRYGSQPVDANFSTYVGQAFNYPDSQYSPTWVFMNGEYAVGVSVIYPMLDYQHDIRLGLMNPTGSNDGEGGPGWGISARVSNRGTEPVEQQLPFPAMIPAGQERTYVMCVRVTNNPGEWTRTLVPYRTFFRQKYGGVTYRREGKPVQPVVIAESSYLESSNPLGFTYIASRRPDVFGWKPWVDALKLASKTDIQMLWAPSGLYYAKAAENFPFQMTTHWQSTPKLATALDPQQGLRAVADAGVPLGLWWGRSIEVATEWEPNEMVSLDPENPEHRAAAYREMDLAVQAGVTTVGLDTFNPGRVQLAKLYNWLHVLRVRYPSVKFIVEPNACDMLHTMAGSFISGWKDDKRPATPEGLYRVNVPHALADFLLPGHETFLAFRYNGYRQYFGITPNQALIEQDARKFAAIGYTPVLFEDTTSIPAVPVARTWETTVPSDLRISPQIHPIGSDATALGDAVRPMNREASPGAGRSGGDGPSVGSASGSTVGSYTRGGGNTGSSNKGGDSSSSSGSSVSTVVRGGASSGAGGGSAGAASGASGGGAGSSAGSVASTSGGAGSKSSGGSAPTTIGGALAPTQNASSNAAQALNRAGSFSIIPSKISAKGKAGKGSGSPIRVVASSPAKGRTNQSSQTAAADEKDGD